MLFLHNIPAAIRLGLQLCSSGVYFLMLLGQKEASLQDVCCLVFLTAGQVDEGPSLNLWFIVVLRRCVWYRVSSESECVVSVSFMY